MNIGERIKWTREHGPAGKVSRKDLADAAGIGYTTLSDLELGESNSTTRLHAIAKRLKVNVEWLETGKGKMEASPSEDIDANWPDVIGVRVAAALGEGIEPDEYAETHKLKFRAESLARKKLDPQHLAVVYGRGESMYPTIKDGDAILFDRRDKTPRKGKLYVVTYDKGLCAKRLNLLGGRWFLESDNHNDPKWHDPILIDEVKGFDIHGRVRWIGSWED